MVDHALEVRTPGLTELALAMACTTAQAAPLAAVAVREVEECAVRLTVADLRGRAHCVTPEFEPRRYDMWTLAAGMPAYQHATGTTTESDHSAWVRPRELLARHAGGEVRMLPPPVISLEELAGFTAAGSLLAGHPRVARVVPELVLGADGIPILRTVLP